jgi:hypothetical protein
VTTHDHPAFVHANEAIVPLDRFPGMKDLMKGPGGGGGGMHVSLNLGGINHGFLDLPTDVQGELVTSAVRDAMRRQGGFRRSMAHDVRRTL